MTDSLVARLRLNAQHVLTRRGYESIESGLYDEAADALEAQGAEIGRLEKYQRERWQQVYAEPSIKVYKDAAEKAEAERDALRVLVSPAAEQAMRDLRAERDAVAVKMLDVMTERDALRQDAERYRWLREHDARMGTSIDEIKK